MTLTCTLAVFAALCVGIVIGFIADVILVTRQLPWH
jgi:hypothetical protein